jgi:hypothetical protein
MNLERLENRRESAEALEFKKLGRNFDTDCAIMQKLFTAFLKENNIPAWHIHDGWVTFAGNTTPVLMNGGMRLTWINQHAGYSHSSNRLDTGELIAIIKDSPYSESHSKKFDLHIYRVGKERNILTSSFDLEFVEAKKCIFDTLTGKYKFYKRKRFLGII